MKKIIGLFMATLLAFSLAACGQTNQEPANTLVPATLPDSTQKEENIQTEAPAMDASTVAESSEATLIVYFSWSTSGNTEKMATYIQEQTGADILRLEPLNPYPTDYKETGDIAKVERDENARPEIANLPDSISQYDTIFVGA